MLLWQGILFLVGLVFLAVASYGDLRKREVPDWLSYGLIFSGLGLRAIFSFEQGWMIFLNGLLGFLVCLGIAYLFYYVNQWGGGDSKLLMGIGGVIGLGLGEDFFSGFSGSFFGLSLSGFDFSLFWFFLGLLVFGAVSGLIGGLVLAVRNKGRFVREFRVFLGRVKRWHYFAWLGSGGFLVLSLFHPYFWPLVIFPVGGFYLLCFAKVVEENFFVRKIGVDKLVEGDWLAEELVVGGRVVVGKGKGLERQELRKLKELWREGKLKRVLVKEGIPLVPSFFLSYLGLGLGQFLGWF